MSVVGYIKGDLSSPKFWTSQSCSLSSNWLCEHPLIITKPALASARLLGLGSKLYPSNMPRMLNKDLSRFMQSLSRESQKKGSASRVLLTAL